MIFKNVVTKLKSKKTIPSYFKFVDKKILIKSCLMILLSMMLLTSSFSWMYHEYTGHGASIRIGSIEHEVREYDSTGTLINDNDETMNLIYETNMSNFTNNSRYIEIKNTGTLDMEYSITFNLEGNLGETGIVYYRIYDITEEVNNSVVTGVYDTKLKAYIQANPMAKDIETNIANPISNLSTINNKIIVDQIEKDEENDENNIVYYRLDYGIYSGIDSEIYSNASMSLHMNVYSSQLGTISNELAIGKVWDVQNEEQFRAALQGAYPGDTIRLLDDIVIDGTIEFNKRISLDTNEQLFKVSGDLVFDFVSLGNLTIDTTGSGRIEVGNDLYINTPKAQVELVGANKASDIVVKHKMTVNGIQEGEKDGILLDNVRIVKNTTSYIPIDLTVLSNTRLTIAPNVEVGFITANTGSTNIEIINNGAISQIQLQNMSLLESFTKPQIYIYNLGDIYGVVGSTSIVLPATAVPYTGVNSGNTLIVKGVTSSDITVSGSENFKDDTIEDVTEGTSVIPFENEDDAYHVYIREPSDVLEELLIEYFNHTGEDATTKIAAIKKLAIYTLNAQYVENEDFDFINSDKMPVISHLDLQSARVIDDTVVNRIKASALEGKDTLTNIILPKTLTEIGSRAFAGINLGNLSPDPIIEFNFINIPASVDLIESQAFIDSKYINFKGSNPPRNIAIDAFNTADDGAKIFVVEGSEDTYQKVSSLNSSNIFRSANVSDNRRYFVYEVGEDLGISYIVNNTLTTTTLGVPAQLNYLSTTKNIVEIGTNAYRHVNIEGEGVAASLPTTVKKINSYAFYQLNITNIDLVNVEFIGKYAFYQTNIERIIAPSVTEIESYAFYNNKATIVSLSNIETIGEYAFAESKNLYELNLASVSYIAKYAFYDCKQMSRVYFENTDARIINNKEEINIYIGENAVFSNWGDYIDGRLRVYVPGGTSPEGSTFLKLYKEKFPENENYIYESGITLGDYYHMEVPQNLTEYTVKEKVITTPSGTVAMGLEIISYQGADLTSDYSFPTELTINGEVISVISVGDGAYRNTNVIEGEKITIFTDNLVNISSNAFRNLDIESITASNVETIGSYAFANSSLNKGIFRSLIKLGDYALTNLDELYVLDLGPIQEFGFNAISNNRHLEQLFMANEMMDIVLNGTPFNNIGTNTNGRLRIYVPDLEVVLAYYKELIPEYESYIYPTGRIEGSYINHPIDYDIGEYSLREVTITDKNGTIHSGYELIEYHGADLTPAYNIPEIISPVTTDIKITWEKGNCWNNNLTCQYNVTIKNESDNDVLSWEFDMALPAGAEIIGGWGGSYTMYDGYATIKSLEYSNIIPINGINTDLGLQITYPNIYVVPEVTAVRINMTTDFGLPIISVGDYAYYHVNTMSGFKYSINNNSILSIGKNAFSGNIGLENFNSNSVEVIKTGAFKDSSLSKASFPNLNKVESLAFSNISNLYSLDLGKVMEMKEKAVSDCNYLYQLYFTGTNLGVTYHSDSLYNIGSLTNNRLRIYVTEGNVTTATSYADNYSKLFNSKYINYFYTPAIMAGSYLPTDINQDINEMSVKKVTKKNKDNTDIVGWEIVEYHGPTLTDNYSMPNTLTVNGETYPIISIGKKAYINNQLSSNLVLSLPTSLLYVEDYAFYQTSLKELKAENVIQIGNYSFSGCNNLTETTLNNIRKINDYAFYSNPNLKVVTLSSTIEEINDYAFYNNLTQNNLTSFYLTATKVPTIYEKSLPEYIAGSDSNKPIIFVPYNSVELYANSDIWKNYQIKNIGNIYEQTFVYETLENNELKITGYLKEIDSLVIPDTLTIEGQEYKVTKIEGSMFDTITDIKTLTLPKYLKSVGDDFLSKNTSIETLIISEENEYFKTVDGILYDKDLTTIIKYPNGKKDVSFTLPEGIILIKSNAFSNAINLTSIIFNSDLFIISNNSFKDCINLTNITFTSIQPPYITAFNVLPINNNTVIKVPTGTIETYKANPSYYEYIKYLQE